MKILGLDSVQVKSKIAIKNTLRSHFDRINKVSRFKGIIKIFVPENNLGNEATHMNSMLKRYGDVKTYWQKDDKPGINKSADLTDNYQYLFYSKLQSNDIVFDMDAFTTSTTMKFEDMKRLAREQLEHVHYEFDPKTKKIHITGKGGPDQQDDLSVAIQMAVYWGRVALRDKSGRLK